MSRKIQSSTACVLVAIFMLSSGLRARADSPTVASAAGKSEHSSVLHEAWGHKSTELMCVQTAQAGERRSFQSRLLHRHAKTLC